MFFRNVIRIAYQGVIYCSKSHVTKLKWLSCSSAKFQFVNRAYLSSFNDGISRGNPLNKEGVSKSAGSKKATGPKITLIGSDGTTSVVSLEDGQKLAKRRNLRLVRLVEYDKKTQRPVYRLMTLAEYNEEFKKEKSSKSQASKKEKILTFTSRIDKHDLLSKVKMMEKWLAKDIEIRVIINGDSSDMSPAENVYHTLESMLKDKSRFLQKRIVHSDVRFHVKGLPVPKGKSVPDNKEDQLPSEDGKL